MITKAPAMRAAFTPKPAQGWVEAFDAWLGQGLRGIFGDAILEPIPQELRDIVEIHCSCRDQAGLSAGTPSRSTAPQPPPPAPR